VAAGIVLVVVIVLPLVALEALTSGPARARIAAALSDALGQPVEIGALSISIFPTPALDAKEIRIGGRDAAAAPGVAVAELRVEPALLSLLPGRTRTINRVDLDGFVVSVRRSASGQWQLPLPSVPPRQAHANSPSDKSSSSVAITLQALHVRDGGLRVVDDSLRTSGGSSTVTALTNIEADVQVANGQLSVPLFGGQLGKTIVTGSATASTTASTLHLAAVSIANSDLPAFFALAGMRPYPGLAIGGTCAIDLAATIGADLKSLAVTGTVAFGQVQLGTIAMQDLRTPFRLTDGIVTLDPVTFTLYAGHERGSVSIDMSGPAPAYAIRTSLTGLDVNQALSANTTMQNFLLGTAKASVDVHARGTTQAAIEQSLAGTVQFGVTDGEVRNMALLATINKVLGLTEGTSHDTKFQSMTGTATMGGGVATTHDLTLKAGELTVLAAGTMGLANQALHLAMTSILSAAKARDMARIGGVTKPLQNRKGEIEIPGSITGTASDPKISVNVGAVAKRELKGVGHALRKLIP
jgi:uncharacterized protein involved in outer membrane biogenesis